jgi:uncharacterized protein (TIGR02145 family)
MRKTTLSLLISIILLGFFSCKKDVAITKPTIEFAETLTDVDGNVYKTIKIGNQIWMVENLKTTHYNTGISVADEISLVEDNNAWKNLMAPAYCWYANDKLSNDQYGALYNADALSVLDATGKPKLAPKGWHVSTVADWQTMMIYLSNNGYDYNGTIGQHTIAKALAVNFGWLEMISNDPGDIENDQASNNKSGFSALPAGFRYSNGNFAEQGNTAAFWHAIESNNMSYTKMSSNSSKAYLFFTAVGNGYSVRCVKD